MGILHSKPGSNNLNANRLQRQIDSVMAAGTNLGLPNDLLASLQILAFSRATTLQFLP